MRNLNLCLHAGAAAVTLDEVAKVETPAPVERWHPIAHRMLYDQVVGALATMNMRVVHEQHALGRNGLRYFSLLQVANCKSVSDDYAYVIGLRNAHDKCFNAGMVFGAGVFVCDNLSFNGEIKIGRKHTTNIERDLPILTTRAVGRLSANWNSMNERFDAYKAKELADAQVHDIAIRALDAGAATPQQIPHIIKEWRAPRHQEFVQAGKTAWRLFNAFTEVQKDSGVFVLPKRTMSLHALLDAECGIVRQEEVITADVEDTEVVVANN